MKITSRIGLAVVTAVAVSVAAPSAADAAPGQLDPSFSGDGKVTTDFTSGLDFASGVAVQADGKIVAAGSSPSRGGQFVIARYNANGSLDNSFHADGKVAVDFTAGFEAAEDVAIQPDGKIVVAGVSDALDTGDGRFALARLNSNGSLDTSFSGDGKVISNFTGDFDLANGVAIQPDGKIVAAGFSLGRGGQFAFARYNPNGGLDPSFDGNGKAAVNFTSGFDFATGVAIQADGKIVAAGDTPSNGGQFVLARVNANGSLDNGFHADGKVAVDFTSGFDFPNGVAIQADGKIVAAGFASSRGGQFGLARLNANGGLDASFDGNGKLATNFTAGFDIAYDVAIQPDGKIVAAGGADGSGGRFALARYLAE